MIETYKKLFSLLDERERKRFYLLMALMGFVSLAELIGISTILVLLRLFSEPDRIMRSEQLKWVYDTIGFNSIFSFQIFMSASVFLIILCGLIIKAGGNYAIIRFSTMRGYTISCRLLESYLHQPYIWFLDRNSAEISKNVLSEIEGFIHVVMIPSLMIVSNIMLSLTIVAFLFAVDPLVATISAAFIGGGYILVYLRLRKRLTVLGKEILSANLNRYQMTQEATGGFKEVKILGLERAYVDRFSIPARKFASSMALAQVIGQIPRFALEALTFAIMLVVVLILLVKNDGSLAGAIPTLGIFAISVMRLLPALQNIYQSMASMRSGGPVLDVIFKDYKEMSKVGMEYFDNSEHKMELRDRLELRNISFFYPNVDRASIDCMNLKIEAKSKVGIVGGSGAGKTTLVDIVLGLLSVDQGEILVDGQLLTRENLRSWRKSIGYVPQTIYLTDSSISENIAFGIPQKKIDIEKVKQAARLAALDQFVEEELPAGYGSIVGERGVRLSGGQRQRIGIARALYHDPTLLILDEATSALDNLTERAVLEAVQNIGNEKTIIMIAHRLSTVKHCDMIVFLEHGKVGAVGTYSELLERSEAFKRMATE